MNDFLSECPDLMTSGDVAKLLHVSVAFVVRKARSGEIPAKKIGKYYYFAKPIIRDFFLKADKKAEKKDEITFEQSRKIAKLR